MSLTGPFCLLIAHPKKRADVLPADRDKDRGLERVYARWRMRTGKTGPTVTAVCLLLLEAGSGWTIRRIRTE